MKEDFIQRHRAEAKARLLAIDFVEMHEAASGKRFETFTSWIQRLAGNCSIHSAASQLMQRE